MGTVNVGSSAINKFIWTAGSTYQNCIGALCTLLQGDAATANFGYLAFNI